MINSRFKWLLLSPLLLISSLLLAATSGDVIKLRADLPASYEVVKGDTLWDISGHFLEDPWLWPQVWQINPQIENPDLIYPGDIIELVYVDGVPRLTMRRGDDLALVKLSPTVRRELMRSPVPAILLEDINAYLGNNRLVTEDELAAAPYILEARSRRLFSSTGDEVFARGQWSSEISTYEIIRPGVELKDPETGRLIGIEGELVGTASIVSQDGEQATLVIDEALQEVTKGDRLIPRLTHIIAATYFPEPPAFEVNGRVVDIEFGRSLGGRYDTLVLSVGEQDNIEVGHLLTLQKADHDVIDTTVAPRPLLIGGRVRADAEFTFSGEKFARVLIYKVFEAGSLALVLTSEQAVEINDRAVTP